MKLYDISEAMAAIRDEVEDLDLSGENEDARAALRNMMDELTVSLTDKVEGCAVIIREQNAEADAISEEIARLQAKKRTLKNRVDWLREYVANCLLTAGEKSVKTPRFSVSVRPTRSVAIDDVAALVAELHAEGYDSFIKYAEPEIRKQELTKYMKESGEVFHHAQFEEKNTLYIK